MIKKTTKQSNSHAAFAIVGGLLFISAAAFEALFIIVDVVLFFQGESFSIGLLVGLAIAMLIGWGLVALAKEKLGNVISNIASSGI
jgi:hypothetical protein